MTAVDTLLMKPGKYRNRKVEVGGLMFDSAKEARHWGDLCLLERAGKITRLRRQIRYPLVVEGKHICALIADFAYEDEAGALVVEDVKSAYTRTLPVWRIKSKLFAALYGFKIVEV
jgi:hypothetical protein